MNAIANPQITSRVPTVRRYHLDGTLKSNASDSGNTFAYFTYSFLWNKRKEMLDVNRMFTCCFPTIKIELQDVIRS
jgi:hypothetical protein